MGENLKNEISIEEKRTQEIKECLDVIKKFENRRRHLIGLTEEEIIIAMNKEIDEDSQMMVSAMRAEPSATERQVFESVEEDELRIDCIKREFNEYLYAKKRLVELK